MDDKPTLNTPRGTAPGEAMPDRPLVTFALFAYNQEKYIREAVTGAFSQTYEPLEIILSDDCSTDRTFAIIEEMAAGYAGPHRVRLNRNPCNLGLIAHVNKVMEMAAGELILLAAGDDISLDKRTAMVARAFCSDPRAMLVHSAVREIDDEGNDGGCRAPPMTGPPDDIAMAAISGIYIGAAGAVRKSMFDVFGPISQTETYEDLVFGFRALLLGGLTYVDEPLVKYRKGIGISSEHAKRLRIFWRLEARARPLRQRRISELRHRIATCKQRHADLNRVAHPAAPRISSVLDRQLRWTSARLALYTDRRRFMRGLVSRNAPDFIKAFSWEAVFLLGVVD